jgi:hypothetical protein
MASARVRTTAMVCGRQSASRTTLLDFAFDTRRISMTASATAVDSSSSDAFAVVRPASSDTMVWKLRRASRRPWEISGW